MKKFIYTIAISIAALLSFPSCNDSFLDADSSNVTSGEDVSSGSLKAAQSFLNGAYSSLFDGFGIGLQRSHDDFCLRAIQLAGDMMCEDMTIYNGGFFFASDYQNANRAVNYRRPRSTWSQMYFVIYSANNALNALSGIENPTAEELQCKAEALALRGYSYFVLINMFQQPYSVNKQAPGIPIYTVGEEKLGRNPVSEVYDIILADLTESYTILQGKGKNTPVTVNEYSVAGMLARVLCFVNDYPSQWAEVAKYADIATQGATLMSTAEDFTSGFNSVNLPEVLWGSAITDENSGYYGSFMSNIDPYNVGYAGIGYPLCIASELYDKIDPNDLRYQWFFHGTAGEDFPKFVSKKYTEHGENSLASDYIFMKAGEMYYLKAEALYLDGDQTGARTALEAVMATRLTGYSAASLSGAALLEEIRIQKRIDCWGEGMRLFDMKWRGEALDRRGSTNHVIGDEYPMQLPANPREWVYMIPQIEMDANPEITENNP